MLVAVPYELESLARLELQAYFLIRVLGFL